MGRLFDLALDTGSHDLKIVGFDFGAVTDEDAITQRLLIKMNMFMGEYFLNTNFGVPWYQQVLVKTQDIAALEDIFKSVILETPGVAEILEFDMNHDAINRSLAVEFTVTTDTGELITFAETL